MPYTLYYPAYDINVDPIDGEINLPICKCPEEDGCIFMKNWISDGKPTHIPKDELDTLNSEKNITDSEPFVFE
jgi:hypothetical protein